jgi:hypothetical protein
VVPVRTAAELRAALTGVQPGTRITLAPGEYPGSIWCQNVFGDTGRPIIIAAADPRNPPVIKGGTGGLQLSGARYVEIHDLRFEGIAGNALAIDDAGVRDRPAHHILVKNARFSDIGPIENHDAIKLAGVDDFRIEGCTFDRWSSGGAAIDGVGCHKGIVESNQFRGNTDTLNLSGVGIQFKGGSRDITIRRNRFEQAGRRAINIGGSTGTPFFRPPLESWPASQNRYEARNIRVEGNMFVGAETPLAFVNVDGAVVRFNTIYHPGRWALRILQETRLRGFGPSRNGVFSDNLIIFDSGQWGEGGVNIGEGTAPKTFVFARNFWYCTDSPSKSRPTLPVPETDGVYGKDPQVQETSARRFRLDPLSPARKHGATALPL